MYSLFIDTHDTDITLCLYKDGITLDNISKSSLRNHSDYTMPLIDELINNNSLDIHDIEEIIVVNGPGSFTGVRLGVTIAKTLAFTLNIPIKTITSLEMYAISYNSDTNKLVTISDVKGVFVGLFTSDNKLIGDLFYNSNHEFEIYLDENNLRDNLIDDKSIDFNKIYEFLKDREYTPAHSVNPIYIKVIEALK